jgi:glycosyltransferase involved in cell wall biosynthesis
VRFTGFVSDADLAFLYRRASLFALPSAYEGFGMPAVEAMGLGCRALVTDAAALPEVTMGRAHYLPLAAGAGAWGEAMAALLHRERPGENALAAQMRARHEPRRIARLLLERLGETVEQASRQ